MIIFKEPRKINSANIQAEFYKQCIDNNLPVHLEYRHDRSRFDAIVYSATTNDIKFIIEIKSYKEVQKANVNTKQIAKYSQYGIPIIVLGRMSRVADAVKYIKEGMYDDNLPSVLSF